MRLDLHIHSTASDGSLTPAAIAPAARAGGLDVIAIADHDTVSGIAECSAAADQLHVIPAVELSTTVDRAEQHLLGYFIDPKHPALRDYGSAAITRRRERVRGMLGLLQNHGITVSLDEVVALAEPGTRMLGRPHVARALVHRGFVQTVSEAFDRFLGDQGPAFLPTQLISPRDAIRLIHDTGGIAIWAHPRMHGFERELDRLVGYGLDGIECYRPNANAVDLRTIELEARRRDLLLTGGSDWHGPWQGKLGDFSVSPREIERFLDRGGI